MSASAFSWWHWITRSAGVPADSPALLPPAGFHAALRREQLRCARTGRPFVLMLLDCARLSTSTHTHDPLLPLCQALSEAIRATDTLGWYHQGSVLGGLFTELGSSSEAVASATILAKIRSTLSLTVDPVLLPLVTISLHVYPNDWAEDSSGPGGGSRLDPTSLLAPRKASISITGVAPPDEQAQSARTSLFPAIAAWLSRRRTPASTVTLAPASL